MIFESVLLKTEFLNLKNEEKKNYSAFQELYFEYFLLDRRLQR